MKKVAKFEKVSEKQFLTAVENLGLSAVIKNLNLSADYKDIVLPKRATTGSAGYDFFSPFDFSLEKNQTIVIPTGIRAKIMDGYFLAIYPRSGLGFKYRAQLDNTVGIIDSDYYFSENEGHIMLKITNLSLENKTLSVLRGKGFAQGIFTEYFLTDDDAATDERNGGFGSTTK